MGQAKKIRAYTSNELSQCERATISLVMLKAIGALRRVECQVSAGLPCGEDQVFRQRENPLSRHENEGARADGE